MLVDLFILRNHAFQKMREKINQTFSLLRIAFNRISMIYGSSFQTRFYIFILSKVGGKSFQKAFKTFHALRRTI